MISQDGWVATFFWREDGKKTYKHLFSRLTGKTKQLTTGIGSYFKKPRTIKNCATQ